MVEVGAYNGGLGGSPGDGRKSEGEGESGGRKESEEEERRREEVQKVPGEDEERGKRGEANWKWGRNYPAACVKFVLAVLVVVWLGITDTRIAGQRTRWY